MKADGGALFYIIIAVLSLIVSAISKNNNKKAAGKPVISGNPEEEEETEEIPQNPWEKELQEIFGKKEPASVPEKGSVREIIKPDRDTVPEITGTQEAVYAQETEEEIKNYRGEISTEHPDVKSVSEDEIRSPKHAPEEEPVFSSGFEEFDLRKAIIYNEVLNRKYF